MESGADSSRPRNFASAARRASVASSCRCQSAACARWPSKRRKLEHANDASTATTASVSCRPDRARGHRQNEKRKRNVNELRQKQRLGTPFLQFRVPLFRRLPGCGKPNQQEARHRPQQFVPRAEPNAPVHLDAVVKHFASDEDRQKNGHSAEQRSHQAGLRERCPQHERDDNQSPSPRGYLDIQRVKRPLANVAARSADTGKRNTPTG